MNGVTSCLGGLGLHATMDYDAPDGNKQVINELVKFIKETLPFIATDKQTSFVMKYEDLAVLYNLPSLVIPPSTAKPIREFDKTTFRDELQRSVLLSMNVQTDDEPESRTADGYKTHLEL